MGKVSDKVLAQRRAIADDIAEAMERDGLEWVKPWASLELPRNGKSGQGYHGRNIAHLMGVAKQRGYTDPRWLTFNQIRSKGLHLRKGEKSALVEKWGRATSVIGQDDDGQNIYASFPVFQRAFCLFNAEQVDGIDDWHGQIEELDDKQVVAVIDRLIASSRCPVSEGADEAYYAPSEDEIRLPDRRLFFAEGSAEAFLRVLIHEMAHSTDKPLNRPVGERLFGGEDYAKEELVAELTSVFVASELGFSLSFSSHGTLTDGFAERHLAYLRHWQSHIRKDPEALFKAVAKASEASDYIIARYKQVA